MAYDKRDNSIWLVTGLADGSAGLIQYDAASGRTLSTAAFEKGMADPHGLVVERRAVQQRRRHSPRLARRRLADARIHFPDRLRLSDSRIMG